MKISYFIIISLFTSLSFAQVLSKEERADMILKEIHWTQELKKAAEGDQDLAGKLMRSAAFEFCKIVGYEKCYNDPAYEKQVAVEMAKLAYKNEFKRAERLIEGYDKFHAVAAKCSKVSETMLSSDYKSPDPECRQEVVCDPSVVDELQEVMLKELIEPDYKYDLLAENERTVLGVDITPMLSTSMNLTYPFGKIWPMHSGFGKGTSIAQNNKMKETTFTSHWNRLPSGIMAVRAIRCFANEKYNKSMAVTSSEKGCKIILSSSDSDKKKSSDKVFVVEKSCVDATAMMKDMMKGNKKKDHINDGSKDKSDLIVPAKKGAKSSGSIKQ